MLLFHVLNPEKIKSQFSKKEYALSPFDVGIPLIEAADKTIQEIYYFRWHTFCRHIREIPGGYVITEFTPDVPWAGKFNSIPCPAGHHFYEGRWLHETKYMEGNARFWMGPEANPRRYSFWAANSIWALCEITGNFSLAESLFSNLKENYAGWEKENGMKNGLFYQIDARDGMEYSISGPGCRPTINSYMYADALALSKIAKRLGKEEEAILYERKAQHLLELVNKMLWDEEKGFYMTLAERLNYEKAPVLELIGYVPWCFGLADTKKARAWRYLWNEEYFAAPYGPTTAQRSHPDFMKKFDHECLWNGPSWPFATAQTLTALGNLLEDENQHTMKPHDYYRLLHQFAACHYLTENGKTIPFIDENLDPFTGEWLARKILRNTPKSEWHERGIDYNHSSFCDLVLTGLAGVRPEEGKKVRIHPLFEAQDMDYFCADGIVYRGHSLCILWDRAGAHYGRGPGLHIYADGKEAAHSTALRPHSIQLSKGE